MQSEQMRYSLPWGHGLHSAQLLFCFPCAHRFPPMAHHASPLRARSRARSQVIANCAAGCEAGAI